jgi:hypothetical protein
MGWAKVLIAPLTMYAWLAGMVVTATRYPRHAVAWILGLSAACLGVFLLLALAAVE